MLLRVAIYWIIYQAFVRKLCKNGHYPATAVSSFWLITAVFLLVYVMSLVAIHYGMEWMHALYALICCIFIMIGEYRNVTQVTLQREMQVKETLWRLNKAQYEMTNENIEIINRKSHDLRHQLIALRTLGTQQEKDEAIASMEQAVQIYDTAFKTGNKTLDIVLMQKGLICHQNHIVLSFMADGRLLDFIDPVDLYTMLANILDNAIEANLRVEEEKRSIHLSVHERKGLIILQVENPYRGEIHMKDGLPLTSKQDKSLHGFGTQSIVYTVEKHGGMVRIMAEDGMYVLRIIFQAEKQEATNQDEKLHN